MQLRPYQDEMIASTRARLMAGCRRVLMQAPTGAGKTALTAHMLGKASSKGKRSWFIVHRRELVAQSLLAFRKADIECGVIAAGFPRDPQAPVQIASIQTVARRLQDVAPPDMIAWDECHHIAAASWKAVFDYFPRAIHVGLSATPMRLDGRGLNEYFDDMILGPSTAWLIENGYLSPFRCFAPPAVSMEGVHTRGGDYATDELAAKFDKPSITGDAVSHYLKLCAGKRAVVFACNIEHSRHIALQFESQGVPAVHVDGNSDNNDRDEAIRQFRAGEIKVLTNVDLFGEGFDLPAIECAILLRPTQSVGLYLQQVGRALRTFEGKTEAIILDHAGNVYRHGLPDTERVWTLKGREKQKKSAEKVTPVRMCPKCFAALPAATKKCTQCGHVFEVEAREVEQRDGVLAEITASQKQQLDIQWRREQGSAQSLADLTALGVRRGYKNPAGWAKHIIESRMKKRAAQEAVA